MFKIKRSRDRQIINMRIPIPGKGSLYVDTGPKILAPIWNIGSHQIKRCQQFENEKNIPSAESAIPQGGMKV